MKSGLFLSQTQSLLGIRCIVCLGRSIGNTVKSFKGFLCAPQRFFYTAEKHVLHPVFVWRQRSWPASPKTASDLYLVIDYIHHFFLVRDFQMQFVAISNKLRSQFILNRIPTHERRNTRPVINIEDAPSGHFRQIR